MSSELRHHCRRCRTKLAQPVSNPLSAFCCKGCFRITYTSRCIVCDGTKSGKGLACTRPKCKTELASMKRFGTRGKYVEGPHRAATHELAPQTLQNKEFPEGFRHVAGPALSSVEAKAMESYWPEPKQEGFTPEQRASAKAMRRSEYERHGMGRP
jgi:hypothetical protein